MPIFLFVELGVADGWAERFEQVQDVRAAGGAVRHWVYRHAELPDDALVVLEFASAAEAVAFTGDPGFEGAMAAPVVRWNLRFESEAMDY